MPNAKRKDFGQRAHLPIGLSGQVVSIKLHYDGFIIISFAEMTNCGIVPKLCARRSLMEHRLNFKLLLDYFVFLAVRLVEEVLNLIPEKWAFAAGRFVGRLLYVLLPDRREAAIENLTIAFGNEESSARILSTARQSFEHVGQVATEFFLLRRWTQEDMAERINIEGRLPYNLAMMPGNHGICLLNSHFGCFEVSAATIKFLGIRLNLIATGLKNPFLSRYFFSRGGEESGVTTFPHKGSVKELIRLTREGEMLACLADQRGDAERGVFVDFFGSKAPANEVFARMAVEGEAWILPLCTYRIGDGKYRSIFGDEIRIQLTANAQEDLVTVSQQFHDLFEKWVRIDPKQGFWLQRKWRRKPSRRRPNKVAAKATKDEETIQDSDSGTVPADHS
jgi:Kdo2-lipid IVA lauroyltransferase/acyltransferase